MGRELFIRHERGYELTGEGRALLSELSEVEARIIRLAAAPAGADKGSPGRNVRIVDWWTVSAAQPFGYGPLRARNIRSVRQG